MDCIESGVFEVVNPFNCHIKKVPATPADVHTIVFWSKNFGSFLKHDYGGTLQRAGYNLFFNFTVNSTSTLLEPQVPSLSARLAQLKQLADQFGPRTINWRFDPICHFKTGEGNVQDNLDDLDQIAAKAAESGIERCITSFMDPYHKIEKRLANLPGFSFSDPPLKTRQEIILKMEKMLTSKKMRLMLCCEKEVLEGLPDNSTVTQSACIPNDLLMELFGGRLSLKRDSGQRVQKGCGCKVSVDIGVYHQHPCYHNCLFCYANPTPK
jgi:DNA repair photolyase